MLNKILHSLGLKRTAPSTQNKTILVIDDGESERTFMSTVLRKRGYNVYVASDGEAGLGMTKKHNPDLIILDLMMPGINGKEVCYELKKVSATSDIPVVFLTSSSKPADLLECYEVGAEYFLQKPIDGGSLIRQIEKILHQSKMSV